MDKHSYTEEIPTRLQTAVHLIIQSLVERQIISVRQVPEEKPAGAVKKKSKRTKR